MLDEADRLLNMDFEQEIDQILKVIPKDRRTQLFSATMTSKVAKLQRACLVDPVKVEVASKYQTVDTLRQQYLFIPAKHKVNLRSNRIPSVQECVLQAAVAGCQNKYVILLHH